MSLSVLMAVYSKDNPIYLDKCLNSLALQTWPANEIIIIRDGELPIELNEVIIQWSKKIPILTYGYDDNKGLAYALNYGLKYCSCELIARMDADDICSPDRFEKQVTWFGNNPKGMVLGTAITEFYKNVNGQVTEYVRKYPGIVNLTSKYLYMSTPLAHPSVMVKANVIKENMYNTKNAYNEDLDLWFRLLKKNYILNNLTEPLLMYRITDSTFSRRSIKKAISEIRVYIKNLYEINGISIYLIIPVLRFFSRLVPKLFIKYMYLSVVRKKIIAPK